MTIFVDSKFACISPKINFSDISYPAALRKASFMTQIEKITSDLFDHLTQRGWNKPQPGSLAKSIILEAAELLEHFQWSEPNIDALNSNPTKMGKLEAELADIMIYCLQFAKVLEIDVEKIIRAKTTQMTLKYPVDEVKNNNQNYYKLKNLSRQNETSE